MIKLRSGRSPACRSTARCAAGACATGRCSGSRSGSGCGRRWSSSLPALLGLFLLLDRDARPALKQAYVAALITDEQHHTSSGWCRTISSPFATPRRRAVTCDSLDHVLHHAHYVIGQVLWLLPAGLIALPLFGHSLFDGAADAYDHAARPTAADGPLLAFGPVALPPLELIGGRDHHHVGVGLSVLAHLLGPMDRDRDRPADRRRARLNHYRLGLVTALYAFSSSIDARSSPAAAIRRAIDSAPRSRRAQHPPTGEPLRYVVASMTALSAPCSPRRPRALDRRQARARAVDRSRGSQAARRDGIVWDMAAAWCPFPHSRPARKCSRHRCPGAGPGRETFMSLGDRGATEVARMSEACGSFPDVGRASVQLRAVAPPPPPAAPCANRRR